MYQGHSENNSHPPQDYKETMNQMECIIRAIAFTPEMFLRYRMGARYISAHLTNIFGMIFLTGGLGILAALLFFGGFTHGANPAPLILFFVSFFALVILRRIGAAIRGMRRNHSARPNIEDNSRFVGKSYLEKLLPLKREMVQRYLEPTLTGLLGLGIAKLNPPLGAWLILSGICLAIVEQMDKHIWQHQQWNQQDAEIEAEYYKQQRQADTLPHSQEQPFIVQVDTSAHRHRARQREKERQQHPPAARRSA